MTMPEVISVAIVGATGTIGSNIVPCLLRSEAPVFVSLQFYNPRVIMFTFPYRRSQLWFDRAARKHQAQQSCRAFITSLQSISAVPKMISSPP